MDNDVEKEPFLEADTEAPIISNNDQHEARRGKTKPRTTARLPSAFRWVLTIACHLATSLVLTGLFIHFTSTNFVTSGQEATTAAFSIIDTKALVTEIDVPRHNLWEDNVFRGDNANQTATEAAWAWVTHYKGSRLSEEEAQRLNMETIPLPGNGRATIMAAFHNIHCLNSVRQFLHKWNGLPPDEFAKLPHDHEAYMHALSHTYHCVEVIRSSVMCNPDTNFAGLEWTDEHKDEYIIRPDQKRQCVNWKAFEQWAEDRDFPGKDVWRVDDETSRQHHTGPSP